MKRTIIIFCMLLMVWVLIADGTFPEGSGSVNDPFLIECLDNLLWLSTVDDYWHSGVYYLQTENINASETQLWNNGAGFDPIGRSHNQFKANYNGDGYSIDSLYINRSNMNQAGLFSITYDCEICNLNMNDINIRGDEKTGGLIGKAEDTSITNCNINGTIQGESMTGILSGYCLLCEISNCSTSGCVFGNDTTGGLSGTVATCEVIRSFSESLVVGNNYSGGLFGSCYSATIDSCRADSQISTENGAGGLIGFMRRTDLLNSYSEFEMDSQQNFGGLTGIVDGSSFDNCYYSYTNSLFNDEAMITIGALTDEMFETWLLSDLHLSIENYLESNDNRYNINNVEDFTTLLAFGQDQQSFRLCDNIDLSEFSNFFIPFFNGDLDGQNYTISNLDLYYPQNDLIALFGYLPGGRIANLQLIGVNVTGGSRTGGLAGGFKGSNGIENCSVSGEINGNDHTGGIAGFTGVNIFNSQFDGSVNGNDFVGGIAGSNGATICRCCSVTGNITGNNSVGGIVGDSACQLERCYAVIEISGQECCGGLAGITQMNGVFNCYARGNIDAVSTAGGLTGDSYDSSFLYNYASMTMNVTENYGGLMGYCSVGDYGYVYSNIWDIELSGVTEPSGNAYPGPFHHVFGATASEMRDISTYTDIGWDFEGYNGIYDYWSIDPNINDGLPYLTDLPPSVNNDNPLIVPKDALEYFSNYPNPFNPSTKIEFSIKNNSNIDLTVYNIKGQIIKKLADDYYSAGTHSIVWNGDDDSGKTVGSGIYYNQIKVNGKVMAVKKCLLLK